MAEKNRAGFPIVSTSSYVSGGHSAHARRARVMPRATPVHLTYLVRLRVLDAAFRNLERRIVMHSARGYFRRAPYRRRRYYRGPYRRSRRISDLQILAVMLLIIIVAWLISSH